MDLIHQMLERNARKYPKEVAVHCHVTKTTLTWREENQLANQYAQYFMEKGVKRRDHVAILFSNQVEFVISLFALLKLGAVAIPLNVRLTPNEISQITQSMDATTIVYHPAFEKSLKDLTINKIAFDIKDKKEVEGYEARDLNINMSTEDIAEILLTSGTTGKPKGVMLSHRSIYQTAMMMSYEIGIYYQDRILQIMPLTHSAPLNLMLMGGTFAGSTSILENFVPERILELIEEDKITHFFGAPIAYLLALKILQSKSYDLTSIKKWLYGGAPMPSNYLSIIRKKFPGEFIGLYGLTEAGPNGIALFSEEHVTHIGAAGKRGTVNTEFRLVDENGEAAGVNKEGEVLLKTNSMMSGYYKNDEATKKAIVNGWLYTGDIGKLDEDGYLYIIDRKKDVIISGGVNIYPSEVEEVIYRISGVQDVAVISKPHEEWGETAIAVIVKVDGSTLTEEEIKDELKDHLAKYKIPREIQFVNELPRNASGKILKHQLREMYK